MRASIISTPVTLFPVGSSHEALTLYNRGPATIFIDTASSVSSTTSYPLLAGTSMIWNDDAPLYAVTLQGTAILDIILNSGGIQSLSKLSTLVFTIKNQSITDGSSYTSPRYDCASYGTLTFTSSFPLAWNGVGAGEPLAYVLTWYDDDGIAFDTLSWFSWSEGSSSPFARIPVKGSYFTIRVAWIAVTPGQPLILNLTCRAFTEVREFANDTIGSLSVQTYESSGDDVRFFEGFPSGGTTSLYIPSLGNTISLNLTSLSGVTVAGAMSVQGLVTPLGSTRRYGREVIPIVSGASTVSYVVYAPITQCLRVAMNPSPTVASGLQLTVTYPGYQP